jgi:hypothetical protein
VPDSSLRDQLRPYEGMRWDCIPWRVRLMAARAYPRQGLRIACEWFRQVTALPGDEFEDFACALELRVVEVKPRTVTCAVRSRCGVMRGLVPERRAYSRRPGGFWI